jgi:hypothetical protein
MYRHPYAVNLIKVKCRADFCKYRPAVLPHSAFERRIGSEIRLNQDRLGLEAHQACLCMQGAHAIPPGLALGASLQRLSPRVERAPLRGLSGRQRRPQDRRGPVRGLRGQANPSAAAAA